MLAADAGSSPHARGLRIKGLQSVSNFGIIPARAGFTPPGGLPLLAGPDHPRTRGVYLVCIALPSLRKGSSPHARGLPGHAAACDRRSGIIPARAGFTPAGAANRLLPPDHPRTRGVYRLPLYDGGEGLGSSPHARGLLGAGGRGDLRERIIPARAGFTLGLEG